MTVTTFSNRMTNPYTPPRLPPDDLDRFPVAPSVSPPGFWRAIKTGGLASAISAVCIAVFFNFSDVVYGNDMASMPFFWVPISLP